MSKSNSETNPEGLYPTNENAAHEPTLEGDSENRAQERPARWRRAVAAASAVLAVGTVQGVEARPAHADHEDTGAPDLTTFSSCDSGVGTVNVGITNLSTGHWLDATLEIPYFDSEDNTWSERLSPANPETHQPTESWQRGGLSGDTSMPPGEVGYTLIWEGHDGGDDHVATGTLAYPGIECPHDGTKDGESYFTTSEDDSQNGTGGGGGTNEACPKAHVPPHGFADISGNIHEYPIACAAWWKIANGVNTSEYAPARPVTRAEMASFIARTVGKSEATLPKSSDQGFTDTGGSVHEDNINKLAEAGIVNGVNAETYAPLRPVRRDQMASFLTRAFEYVADDVTDGEAPPLSAKKDYFSDDDGNTHEANINKAAEAGWTKGKDGNTYAPGESVRRDQMASFITRTLDQAVKAGYAFPPNER